jgi:hypothetical protein
MEYYSAIKKNEILSFPATQMKMKSLSEMNQARKNKCCSIFLTCRIYKIDLVAVESRVAVTRGSGQGVGTELHSDRSKRV